MEETKNTSAASQPEKPKKDDKKGGKKSGNFFAEHKAELRKVTWPNRQELMKETVTVLVVSLLVGAIIFCMDTALSFCYDKLISIGSTNTAESSNEINPADLISVNPGEEDSPVNIELETGADAGAEVSVDTEAESAQSEEAQQSEPDENAGSENAEADNAQAEEAQAEAAQADNAGTENAEQ